MFCGVMYKCNDVIFAISHSMQLFSTYTQLQKASISSVKSTCMSAHIRAVPTRRISAVFDVRDFYRNLSTANLVKVKQK
jgi:hypothetical protein